VPLFPRRKSSNCDGEPLSKGWVIHPGAHFYKK
jgi:hypothetical protein